MSHLQHMGSLARNTKESRAHFDKQTMKPIKEWVSWMAFYLQGQGLTHWNLGMQSVEREIIPKDDRLLSRWLVNQGARVKYWCFVGGVGDIVAKLTLQSRLQESTGPFDVSKDPDGEGGNHKKPFRDSRPAGVKGDKDQGDVYTYKDLQRRNYHLQMD